jgi:hypothetical protein
MMSSKNSGFTAKDIDRYHSGKMSDQERHAIEKAALDDPFLADALEGYAFTPTASADLASIRSRLNVRLSNSKVVPFYRQYKWLSAVAIVLILAGAGWLVISISGKKNESYAVAPREPEKKNQTGESKLSAPNPTDTTKISSSLNYQNGTVSRRSPSISEPSTNNGSKARIKSHEQSARTKETAAPKTEVASVLASVNAAEPQVAPNSDINRGAKDNLTRNATSPSIGANNPSQAYSKTAPPANNVASTTPALIGRSQGVIPIDTIKNMNVVMHPLPQDSLGLSEVVVVGYGAKKKPLANVYHPHVTIDTLEPEEGYDSFDEYVATNLNLPEEYKTKAAAGEVQLSFDVDRSGQPINITVVKSLCQKCDDEAIRLLKEGPKWKKKKDKKGKVTIAF